MSNSVITVDIVAKEAMAILENNLGVMDTFHRAYEDEFDKKVNGYEVGETISIRRPHDPRVRRGSVAQVQNVVEGKVPLTVSKVYGHDFRFSSEERTLRIQDLSERVIKPAMINIVNEIVADVLDDSYKQFHHWMGISGTKIDSFGDFGEGVERLNEQAVPVSDRKGVLSPTDHMGLLGTQTGLFIAGANKEAYRDADLGRIAGVDTYMSQVVPWHTNGTADNTTPLVRGAAQNKSYDAVKDTWKQDLSTDGWDNSSTITKGSVFTIGDCYMVNPRTKKRTAILQQFVVLEDVVANANSANETVVSISPPIITSGPHQTVEFTSDMDDNAITLMGAANGQYRQNLMYHKSAIALAVVPMVKPDGAVDVVRQTHKGLSLRMIPSYDGINDLSHTRLDILLGWTVPNPAVGLRISAIGG